MWFFLCGDQQALGPKPILCPGPWCIKAGRHYSGLINTLTNLIHKIADVLLPPEIGVNLQPGLFCITSILQKHPALALCFLLLEIIEHIMRVNMFDKGKVEINGDFPHNNTHNNTSKLSLLLFEYFHFFATLYFYSTTHREILYFILHYVSPDLVILIFVFVFVFLKHGLRNFSYTS